MELTSLILLIAGLTSGVMNALAGGGSFVSFPMLIFLGLGPIAANVTSTVALVPGTLATMIAYRNELKIHNKKLPLYIFLSLAGGLVGALILLHISNEVFSKIVPFLILIATFLFTFRTSVINWIKKFSKSKEVSKNSVFYKVITLITFTSIMVYGGFFGAGMGILTLALFSLMGMNKLNEMNALRSCTGLCANISAMLIFVSSEVVIWPYAINMAIGAIIGGYFGAYYARKLPNDQIRNIVIIIGWLITLYFFWKQYR